MIQIVRLVPLQLSTFLKSRARLQLEILVLRHQLDVLSRTGPKTVRVTDADRFVLTWLYHVWPKVTGSIAIIRPATLVRWHRQGFEAYWRRKSRRHGGRPMVPTDVRDFIRQMSV